MMNLAIEEAIIRAVLEEKVEDTIRFWINPPCVIIGRYQIAMLNCNIEYCKKNNIEIVRRESSGGAVYQDEGNWNHSIFVKNPERFVKDPNKVYEIFSSLMVDTLQNLGIPATFSPPNDILLNNKKISGAAQFELYDAFLHHATLLVKTDLQNLAKSLIIPKEKLVDKEINSILERVTTIEKEGYSIDSINSLARAYSETIEKQWNVSVELSNLTSFEKRLAEDLYKLKYKTSEWNIDLILPESKLFWLNYKIPTGLLQIGVELSEDGKINEIIFTGDLSIKNFEIFNIIREKLLFVPLKKEELFKKLNEIDLSPYGVSTRELVETIVNALDNRFSLE